MFCIHSPPVSRSTAKLHENQQPLWCCFGLSWKRKIKRWLCFFIYFVQRLTVGGNGRITVACWCIVTTANKNLAVNCGEVASQTYGILQYKNLLMAQYRCLRCSNLFMSFFVFFIELKYNLSVRKHLPQWWKDIYWGTNRFSSFHLHMSVFEPQLRQ